MKRVIGLALLLAPGVALPQAVPANLDFEQGEPGKVPAWWFVPQGLLNAGYSAELRREGCKSGLGCAVVLAPENGAMPFANLMQRFDAAPYRGKLVRLRAWVRLDTRAPGDRAQLWFRVDRGGGQMGFFDNMGNRPITSAEWRACEIEGEIDEDAGYINIGLMSVGKGRAWIDGLSLDVAPVSAASEAVRRQIQELYGRIDATYERRDFDAVLRLALPDATAGFMGMKQPLRVLVDMMRARLKPDSKIASRTRVTSVEMRGDTALVSVSSDLKFSSAGEERALVNVSRDSWVRVPDGWRLKESTQVSSRPVAPPTSAEATARLAAELKRYAAPLKTVEAGNAMGDLAAFGRAVGDARIVSLGEASHGTKEFFQIKHRLLEYLVKEKGFTVFAIEANWPESLAVDRYVKSGEGDPKAALAGMYFWTWNTQEVLDMIEWMRAYNKAAGKAVLSFTSFDMQTHRVAAAQALEYLRKFLPGEAKAAEAGFGEVDKIPRGQMSAPHAAAAAEQAEKVVALFDARREALVKASSPEAWRNARQAAEIVRQAAAMR
ncbi:MAG: erythromycin esterase family protein, partial [Acidobacteria bacterium]|nr:erythromycin esterase family protein [Acidobacteriota bacterium]